MIVVGIDPGFANLGIAAIEIATTPGSGRIVHKLLAAGIIRTKPQAKIRRSTEASDLIRRMRFLRSEILGFAYEEPRNTRGGRLVIGLNADLVPVFQESIYIAVEEMSWCRAKSDRLLGMTWGLLVSLTEQYNLGIIEIPPKDIKTLVPESMTKAGKLERKQSKIAVEDAVLAIPGYGEILEPILNSLRAQSSREHVVDAVAAAIMSLKTDAARIYVRAGR